LSLGFGDGKLVIGQSGFTRSSLYEIDKLVIKKQFNYVRKKIIQLNSNLVKKIILVKKYNK